MNGGSVFIHMTLDIGIVVTKELRIGVPYKSFDSHCQILRQ